MKRINRLMDELEEFGVDAGVLLFSYMDNNVTQFNYSRTGNILTIKGLLDHYSADLEDELESARLAAWEGDDENYLN